MSCGLTLSSRMRIAVQREIRYLAVTGANPDRLTTLKKQYKYYGDQTCATDGLCSTSCPMKINTGELTHLIRQMDMNDSPMGYKLGEFAANHMAGIKSGLRFVLDVAHLGHVTLGPTMMTSIARSMNKMGHEFVDVASFLDLDSITAHVLSHVHKLQQRVGVGDGLDVAQVGHVEF